MGIFRLVRLCNVRLRSRKYKGGEIMSYMYLIITAILLLLSGCSSQQPANKNESTGNTAENSNRLPERSRQEIVSELNKPIQEAARAELTKSLPDWRIIGWNIQRSKDDEQRLGKTLFGVPVLDENLRDRPAIVIADLARGKERKTLSFAARAFRDDQGNLYWRIEPLTSALQQLILTPERQADSPSDSDK